MQKTALNYNVLSRFYIILYKNYLSRQPLFHSLSGFPSYSTKSRFRPADSFRIFTGVQTCKVMVTLLPDDACYGKRKNRSKIFFIESQFAFFHAVRNTA